MTANGLNWGKNLNLAAINGGPTGLLDCGSQVGGGYRAEEAAVGAGGGGNGHDIVNEPGASGLGLLQGLNGPLAAGIAYNKIQDAKANYALGAKYNFGMFALAAGYYDNRNLNTLPVGTRAKLAGYSIGASANFDNFTLAVELQRQRKSEIYHPNRIEKFDKHTDGVIEAKYALSKRTFFYADYFRFDSKKSYGLGIQHRF